MNTLDVDDIEVPSLEALRWDLYYELAFRDGEMNTTRFRWVEDRLIECQRPEFRDAFVAAYVQAALTARVH